MDTKYFGLIICIIGLFLSACSTMDKQQCASADWQNVGRIDGERGRPLTYMENHEEACKGAATVSKDLYVAGWEQGMLLYCEPVNGLEVGRHGHPYPGICPTEMEAAFLEQHKIGWQIFIKKQELSDLHEEISAEKERRANDESVVNHISEAYHLLSGTSATQRMDDRAIKLSDEVNALEAAAPPRLTASVHGQSTDYVHLAGAVTGTVFGFGIGHAIQGRYQESGWRWTLGEVATLGTMVAVSRSECHDYGTSRTDPNMDAQSCSSDWPTLAVVGWLGFRVWQSVNLFSYSKRSEYGLIVEPRQIIAFTPSKVYWVHSF